MTGCHPWHDMMPPGVTPCQSLYVDEKSCLWMVLGAEYRSSLEAGFVGVLQQSSVEKALGDDLVGTWGTAS